MEINGERERKENEVCFLECEPFLQQSNPLNSLMEIVEKFEGARGFL